MVWEKYENQKQLLSFIKILATKGGSIQQSHQSVKCGKVESLADSFSAARADFC